MSEIKRTRPWLVECQWGRGIGRWCPWGTYSTRERALEEATRARRLERNYDDSITVYRVRHRDQRPHEAVTG